MKVSGIGQSAGDLDQTAELTAEKPSVKRNAITHSQDVNESKMSHQQVAKKTPRAGWHIALIWLLALGVTFTTIHSSAADAMITGDELARAAGVSFWPAFIAWMASRFGGDNPRFCAWGAGLLVMFVSVLAMTQYHA